MAVLGVQDFVGRRSFDRIGHKTSVSAGSLRRRWWIGSGALQGHKP
jgi:hypothetical protein